MSTISAASKQTKTAGAVKAGGGRHIFPLTQMTGIEAGTGYSTSDCQGVTDTASPIQRY